MGGTTGRTMSRELYYDLVQAGRFDEAARVKASLEDSPPGPKVPAGAQAAIRFFKGATSLIPDLATNLISLGGEEGKQAVEQYRREQEEMYNRLAPDAGKGWETAGAVTSGVLAGGSSGLLKGGMSTAERLGTLAAEGGMFGGMAPAESGEEMAQNVGVGTVAGAAIPGATQLAVRGVQGIPGAARRVLPISEAGEKAEKFVQARPPGAKEVPLRGEDVLQSGIVRGSGRYLDALDLTNTRVHDLKKYRDALKYDFPDADKDVDQLMKELGEGYTRTYKGLQNKKRELYKNAYASTAPMGDVDTTRFRQELLDQYDRQVQDFGPDSPGAKEIEKWFDYGEGNVETWHNRVKSVSKQLRTAERATDPDTVQAGVFSDIKRSLERTIDDFTGDNQEWQTAQRYNQENIVPYREDAFGKLIRKGQTEKAAAEAVDPAKSRQTAERADRYWKSLDPEGQEKYRETLLAKMLDQGSDAEIPFSSARASSYLDATEARLAEKYIGADERAALDGWQNLLRVSQFAGESAARSRTGASFLQSMLGPATMAGVGTVAGGPAGAAILGLAPAVPALIARSSKARNLLAKLKNMDPQHPDYNSVVAQFLQTAQAAGVSTGATQ
jgi:hypothetical protein